MGIQLEVVKSLNYCAGLNAGVMESFNKFLFEKSYDKNELILLDGDPAKALYFVVSGVVKLFKTSVEGKEQIIRIVPPRESFNDIPVLDGKPNHVSAQAMTPVLVYGLKKSDLEVLLKTYPMLHRNIINVLAGQTRHLIALIEELSFKNVLGRVAKIILEPPPDGSRLTQQDMAAMVGTAREMIGRSLKSLEAEGLIKLDRHRIIIRDKQGLQDLAGR